MTPAGSLCDPAHSCLDCIRPLASWLSAVPLPLGFSPPLWTRRWATEPMSRKLAEVVSRNKYALAMLYEFGYSRREDGSDWLPRFLAP